MNSLSARQRWLCAFYALVGLLALAGTWSQNLAYFHPGSGALAPFGAFILDAKANPASRSLTVDISLFLLAAAAFMVVEARRLGVRFVWLYLALGFLVAISVAFPLFMIARELRLAPAAKRDVDWSLAWSDYLGLAVVTAIVLGLVAFTLGLIAAG